MQAGRGSLPQGKAMCQPCRRSKPTYRSTSTWVYVPREQRTLACDYCGATFVEAPRSHGQRFCSMRCAQRNTDVVRRLRQGTPDAFNREAIFERDHWRCQLCGKPVDRNAVIPQALAPTLDHIVPLSRGGVHTQANVQTAHATCNYRKGPRAAGEQLRLIG